MKEPEWVAFGRRYIGLKEVAGIENEPIIIKWLYKLKAWWSNDEVPWCGVYCAACITECGLPIVLPKYWMRARDWLNWGIPLDFPAVGAVVVFERKGGGHVGFVVGQSIDGHLMVLGGNQNNRVSIAPFDKSRVLGYRWPPGQVVIVSKLPILDSNGKVSANEA